MSGNLDITNNGDGSYTLSFDFVDDQGYAWDGSWSGTISTADYSYYSASAMTRSLLRAPHIGVREQGPSVRPLDRLRERSAKAPGSAQRVSRYKR